MSATLIKSSEHEHIIERYHDFRWEDCPDAGFSFDVDEEGKPVNENEMSKRNYAMCLKGEDERGKKIINNGIKTYERKVFNPALYQCECGRKFYAHGDTKCSCGRWYNAGGQELDAHAMVCSTYAQGYDCMCNER